MNGAESLVRTLIDESVEVCFTNPGTSEMHFVAALDRVEGMRCVLGLFEGVVTGAADGYWRIAHKPAATLLHLGPGLANGLANLHNAKKARSGIVNVVGEHATTNDLSPEQAKVPLQIEPKRKLTVPIDFPACTLNRVTVRAFNALYFRAGARKTGEQLVDWDSFFYPLDAILGWTRIYGRKGFVQFQCALPLDRSEAGLAALLAEIGAYVGSAGSTRSTGSAGGVSR